MISWGLVTILTGLIRTPKEFYVVRFLLGIAEASFFPGVVIYLTHWFRQHERSRALACLYMANPTGWLIGSPLAGWLLSVHWLAMAGWRWLFIAEGIPAILLGSMTIVYLTDWPAQADWLTEDERNWLTSEIHAEVQAKKGVREFSIVEAFLDWGVLLLALTYFLTLAGNTGNTYWIPTFIKLLTGQAELFLGNAAFSYGWKDRSCPGLRPSHGQTGNYSGPEVLFWEMRCLGSSA